jgi:light-regulated signal transduction histidine kinase (bacteriophytochrome)
MTAPRESIREAYAGSLADYLAQADEDARLRAHELGRKALTGGIGLLDLVALHHEVLAKLDRTKSPPLDRAAEFLAESLSPFEMSLRGFREANARLSIANEDLQQAKAASDTANRELEAFSYSVAHDLRAPLRSIDGFSQALLEDCADVLDDTGKRHLRYVREAAQDMAALIDALLGLARVTRSELRRGPVDLAEIARHILAQLQRTTNGRAVEIAIADELPVQGDERLLRSLLENLLGNAWKFTRHRAVARIEVGLTSQNGEAVYFVRDNGAGFDMAYASKLFGAFQRLHSAAEFEGTGIGLATVQRIVKRHGGRIWAEGEMDRGATFSFTLWSGGRPNGDSDVR